MVAEYNEQKNDVKDKKTILKNYFEKLFSSGENTFKNYFENNKIK